MAEGEQKIGTEAVGGQAEGAEPQTKPQGPAEIDNLQARIKDLETKLQERGRQLGERDLGNARLTKEFQKVQAELGKHRKGLETVAKVALGAEEESPERTPYQRFQDDLAGPKEEGTKSEVPIRGLTYEQEATHDAIVELYTGAGLNAFDLPDEMKRKEPLVAHYILRNQPEKALEVAASMIQTYQDKQKKEKTVVAEKAKNAEKTAEEMRTARGASSPSLSSGKDLDNLMAMPVHNMDGAELTKYKEDLLRAIKGGKG